MSDQTKDKKRRLSRKNISEDILPTQFEYENQYVKWKAAQPIIHIEFSVDESGYIYWFWSFLITCGCLYNIVILSVLAFENVRASYFQTCIPLNTFFDILFLIDIIVRSRLSFYEEGVLQTEYVDTSRNYFQSIYFGLDILAIIPFDIVFISRTSSAFCRLNRFLKLYRIADFIAQSYGKLGQVTISLTKIIVSCFLLFHCNACIFYIISVNSDVSGWDGVNATFDDDEFLPWPYVPEKITDTYLVGCGKEEDDCYNQDFYFDEEREQHLVELYHFWREENRTNILRFSEFTKEYTVSIYWSALTMTTLGEQPPPNTSLQNFFEVINTLAGLLLFAVIMGSIGDLVANANQTKTYWQTLMDGLKQYMTYRSLNIDLQTKVLKYCEYEMAEETILKEHEVRDELPAKLYGHVTTSIIGKSLLNSALFRASERSFLQEISEYLEPHYFCPGDVVVEKGQLCSEMFIIVSGQIIEITDDGEIEHYEGEVLGEMNMIWYENHLNNNRHRNNYVSNSFSQIHILTRDDFLKVLSVYDSKMKKRMFDVAYRSLREKGEMNDRKRRLLENEDLDATFRRLSKDADEITQNLNVLEKQFVKFASTAKQRVFKAEVIMCRFLKKHHKLF
ncbi:unnamed protein product [Caenorhabditis angaria]|uniref:Cyclic nucleotide-binding domain-containing protein n=1 Tax=Caenorhabditis angaria TaxID=860376 RepID=A0A9P1IR53_9PELO|nr:unnamed protein product [Caenorhabditis angaria]